MPFKETCKVDETVGFVAAYLEGEETMSGLCRVYGISRQWGYELVRRYRAEGLGGLEPRSRAPHRPHLAMADGVAAAIVAGTVPIVQQKRPRRRSWYAGGFESPDPVEGAHHDRKRD
jgi:hypothetical protein